MCVSYVILQGCDMCIVYHLLDVILNKTKRVWLSSFDIAAIIIACYIASQMPSGPETGHIMGGGDWPHHGRLPKCQMGPQRHPFYVPNNGIILIRTKIIWNEPEPQREWRRQTQAAGPGPAALGRHRGRVTVLFWPQLWPWIRLSIIFWVSDGYQCSVLTRCGFRVRTDRVRLLPFVTSSTWASVTPWRPAGGPAGLAGAGSRYVLVPPGRITALSWHQCGSCHGGNGIVTQCGETGPGVRVKAVAAAMTTQAVWLAALSHSSRPGPGGQQTFTQNVLLTRIIMPASAAFSSFRDHKGRDSNFTSWRVCVAQVTSRDNKRFVVSYAVLGPSLFCCTASAVITQAQTFTHPIFHSHASWRSGQWDHWQAMLGKWSHNPLTFPIRNVKLRLGRRHTPGCMFVSDHKFS